MLLTFVLLTFVLLVADSRQGGALLCLSAARQRPAKATAHMKNMATTASIKLKPSSPQWLKPPLQGPAGNQKKMRVKAGYVWGNSGVAKSALVIRLGGAALPSASDVSAPNSSPPNSSPACWTHEP